MAELWSSLVQHADAGKRTDVLRALIWPISILFVGLMSGVTVGAPKWLLIVLVAFLGLFLLLYILFYGFFAVKDPNLLRSESFNLQRLRIEKAVLGDSETGLLPEQSSAKALPALKSVIEDGTA